MIRKLLTTCCFRCKYDLKVMYALLFWNELCLHKIGAILWKGSCIAFVYVCYLHQRRVNFCTVLADSTKKYLQNVIFLSVFISIDLLRRENVGKWLQRNLNSFVFPDLVECTVALSYNIKWWNYFQTSWGV